jgi:hypothetical protein
MRSRTLLQLSALTIISCSSWPNSLENVHPFLTFDSGLNDSSITSAAQTIQYVWGGHSPRVWHAANNDTVISAYMTFNRDPDASHSLTWWQENHPSWVLYQCDRTTPARVDPADTNIALDVSNPDVVQWQVAIAASFGMEGFDAIAADNYSPYNYEKACGVWRTSAVWINLYNDTLIFDPLYETAMLAWLDFFRIGLHSLTTPLLLIPNFSIGDYYPFDSPTAIAVLNGVDGVLDERGFTGWGSGYISANEFANVLGWARSLQAAGKAFYSINEWAQQQLNGTPPPLPPRAVLEYVVASWLMVNDGFSGVFISCVQCYGWKQVAPQYLLHIGSPAVPASNATSVWTRAFSAGFAAVNIIGSPNANVSLPAGLFVNAYGDMFTGNVEIEGGAGIVLARV